MNPLLHCQALSSGYHGVRVIHEVDLRLNHNEFVCLLGRNGVGKTTLLKTLTGHVPPFTGCVTWDRQDITRLPVYRIARQGVAYVPEEGGVFRTLTVQENLQLSRREGNDKEQTDRILEHLPALKRRLAVKAGQLSGGEQRMLTLARALVSRPRLAIIDEFSQGLQPLVIETLVRFLQQIRKETELAVLMVEQRVGLALDINDRAYVMDKGRLVINAEAKSLRKETSWLVKHLAI